MTKCVLAIAFYTYFYFSIHILPLDSQWLMFDTVVIVFHSIQWNDCHLPILQIYSFIREIERKKIESELSLAYRAIEHTSLVCENV